MVLLGSRLSGMELKNDCTVKYTSIYNLCELLGGNTPLPPPVSTGLIDNHTFCPT